MTSPPTLAMMFNACLLVGCSAITALWNSSIAEDFGTNPTGSGGSVQLEPAPAGSQPRRTRPIFVCRHHAGVIYSDRPCGPASEERSLPVRVQEPQPGRAASTAPAAAPAATLPRPQPEPQADDSDAGDARCRRLREQREKLDDRMRTGYSAREAAQLWNRWRSLNSEIHRSRC